MQYVRLGNSGLKISKIILGCQSYGTTTWEPWVVEEDEGIKQIKAAYDLGIQTFDTADMYSNGVSETILGKAIKLHHLPREELVIMTKVFFPVGPADAGNIAFSGKEPDAIGYVNQHGLSRKHIFDSVKASLARLQLDYIDVLQCHRFDPGTPIAETMQALHDVVQASHVRYIGMSACWAYEFHAMQNYAITHNLTPFISMQNHYSLLYREEEREMFPTLKMFGAGAITWSSLARGNLSRPRGVKSERSSKDQWVDLMYSSQASASGTIVDRVEEMAKKKGVSMSQISIAWLLSKPDVSAPIIGTTKLENLRDIVGAIHLKLTEEEVKYLEEPYVPQGIIGHQ